MGNNDRPHLRVTPPARQPQGLTFLDLGEGFYVSPMIGQMVVAMQVRPAPALGGDTGGTISNGRPVEIELTLIGGNVLHLSHDQADKFLISLGLRQPLVVQVGSVPS